MQNTLFIDIVYKALAIHQIPYNGFNCAVVNPAAVNVDSGDLAKFLCAECEYLIR